MAKIKTKSIMEILQNQSEQILIPIYQRNYDWNKDNVIKLLDDLLEFKDQIDNSSESMYFLGNMVYKVTGSIDDTIRKLILVDGQQRITTTLIILAALRDYGDLNVDMYLKIDENGETKMKISKINNSDILEKIIKGLDGSIVRNDEINSNYYKNYLAIEKYLETKKIQPQVIRNLLERTAIAWVQLDKQENENKTFETINSTGKPLEPSDLIKNYIFFSALHFGEEQESRLVDTYLNKIEPIFQNNEDTNDFFRYYTTIKGDFELPKRSSREIYTLFRKYIEQSKIDLANFEDVSKLVNDIYESAIIYKLSSQKNDGNNNTIENTKLNFFREIFSENKKTYFGIFFSMIDYWSDFNSETGELSFNKEGHGYEDILKTLAKFIIYRSISAKKDKNITRDAVRFFNDFLKESTTHSISEFEKYMENRESIEQRLPKESELLENIKAIDAYKMSVKRTRNILIASELGSNRTTPFSNFEFKWTVEHIMPQEWTKEWAPRMSQEQINEFAGQIHKLPNLTLLSQPMNSSVSNSFYDVKRRKIIDDSKLQIDITLRESEEYNSDLLDKRARIIEQNIKNLFE